MKRLFVVLLCLGLVGCASNHYLLKTNPEQLSDAKLLEYYNKLGTEIARLEADVNQSSSGQRASADSTVKLIVLNKDGASGLNALRLRRTDVRLELEKRGLSPLSGKN